MIKHINSAAQFAWKCCNCGNYPPPRVGKDSHCWLCGGETNGVGWQLKDALSNNFTDCNSAARLDSNTLCQACAATASSVGWVQYVNSHPERGLWTHFPEKEGKMVRACNWLYFSHVFSLPDYHETPTRARWRDVLSDPPLPPFLLIMAVSGKKQILFKGRISYSRESYWVQYETTRIFIQRQQFIDCLTAFELLYNAGFSKDSILTGDYHKGQLLKVGLTAWREMENAIKPYRNTVPNLLSVVHFCATRSELQTVINQLPSPPIVIKPTGNQYDLFI
ncbi:hypothetical protein HUU62_08875 [Rhodoferax sp. 4810]|uniref:Uncharacterized protein n=1 Tax=Thiospirillum jenense TaxID=1653858 RepID=A0A839H732_9GAMM|nr:hypothetical protein [Thiospirillum jenense]MBB1074523.1 hypothetical protein [Rhodoferax jenense]MBB1125493.1 hypothetical protein [Thiospirillum jenense]